MGLIVLAGLAATRLREYRRAGDINTMAE